MTYNFIFEPDYPRIMRACMLDDRASIPQIKNKVGSIINDYVLSQIALINNETIVYKLENELGVMAGFFSIQVNTIKKTATLLTKVIRPAFKQFDTIISTEITNFIMSGNWKGDYLF